MQERLGLRGGKLVNYPTADKLPAVATTTLGVGQANTTEMASAFGTFAAEGVHHDATAILTVTDRNGNELVNNTNQKGEQVLSKSVAYAVTQTLEGVIYKSMGTASAAALSSGQIRGRQNRNDGQLARPLVRRVHPPAFLRRMDGRPFQPT